MSFRDKCIFLRNFRYRGINRVVFILSVCDEYIFLRNFRYQGINRVVFILSFRLEKLANSSIIVEFEK
jgi:hypothetical protein